MAATHLPETEPPACNGFTHLSFEPDSAALDDQSKGMLEALVQLLARSGFTSRLEITANADRLGSAQYNLRLTQRRARTVRDFLVARGTHPSLIEVRAAGETRPLVDTADDVPEPNNRYVQILELPSAEEWKRREDWWAKHGRPKIVC
jgi:outer membrane protein OmpA-like peptidoglycan-associated protein